jgi:hypothetical protein
MTWFKQLLDIQLSSPIPFDFAKAAALRRFVVEDAGAPWMRLVVEDEAPRVKQIISTAQQRVHSEKMARYWFGRFCSSSDLDNSWAAFRLFLGCVDRRCWFWSRHELATRQAGIRKEAFFELNMPCD